MANALQKRTPAKKKAPSAQPSMKWYDFLKDLGLYLYAIFVALMGYFTVVGLFLPEGIEKLRKYSVEYLMVVDIACCVLMLGMAAYAIVIRMAFNKYKAKAPLMLMILQIVDIVINVVQMVVYQQVDPKVLEELGTNYNIVTSIVLVIGGIALIFVNQVYFNKRKAMFQN